jgi:hypothetical protein
MGGASSSADSHKLTLIFYKISDPYFINYCPYFLYNLRCIFFNNISLCIFRFFGGHDGRRKR